MTTAIAQFMRELEGVWEAHRAALAREDLAAALATMTAEPSVTHIPALSGGSGRAGVEDFYTGQFLPHRPADLAPSRISRTVDRLWDYATLLAQLNITVPVASAPVR